ncbi:MAG: DoxX family protein [Bacteroidota bacterium]
MKPFFPSKIAEIIFAIIIAYFGYLHFKNVNMMAAGVPKFFPGDGKIWIYLSGAGFILAAIAIVIDVQKTLACYLLATVLLIFVFAIHIKNFGANPSGVLKDTAMAMAAIIIGNRRSK